MKKMKEVQVRFAALDQEWDKSQAETVLKLKKLRHQIKRAVGEEPITDPQARVVKLKR